jgi:cystathionine gamma-synthase
VASVCHPSLADHPDRTVIDTHYRRHGSLLSFRVVDADEQATQHLADVLATTTIVRYALSFDGPTTKVNHHKTVSEYFSPPKRLEEAGLDRLIRLAVGTEHPDDLIAALNWTLHHGMGVTQDALDGWLRERRAALQLVTSPAP